MVGKALMNTYGERTTTLVKGEGAYVWDDQGKRYLDAVSGIAVCVLGHNFPAVTEAICDQASRLVHCSNLYAIQPQQQLGDALIRVSGMDTVFFSNSGAEANEAAIKIARKFGREKGIDSPEIITANGSFHGRTMATLTATGNEKVKTGFSPLLSGFVHAPYDDVNAVIAASSANTVAVMVEPVQGEGGVCVPSADYVGALRKLCDEKGWLLILDEIQTGNGRTGKYFAYQHNGILPDVVTTAKGLGNGVPIGACLARGAAATTLKPGNHGSTFGGNPLATSAGLAVVNTLADGAYMTEAERLGAHMLEAFEHKIGQETAVLDIRGKGLMIGIELDRECDSLVEIAKMHNLLINVTAGNTIRLLPPLIINDEQAETIVNTVSDIIKAFIND